MAKNLQAKLPPSDTIRLFDLNKPAMDKLADEMERSQAGGSTIVKSESVADAAKDAVGSPSSLNPLGTLPLAVMSLFYL